MRCSNRQMLMKKLPVRSLPCVVKGPPLSCSKVSAKPNVASFRLTVTINSVLGLVSNHQIVC